MTKDTTTIACGTPVVSITRGGWYASIWYSDDSLVAGPTSCQYVPGQYIIYDWVGGNPLECVPKMERG